MRRHWLTLAYLNRAQRPSRYGGYTNVLPVIHRFPRLLRVYRSTGSNGSWLVHVQLGPGAGYRWVDFPGRPSSIHAPRWRHWLTITGRTWSFGRHVVDRRWGSPTQHQTLPWWSSRGFVTNANQSVFPNGW